MSLANTLKQSASSQFEQDNIHGLGHRCTHFFHYFSLIRVNLIIDNDKCLEIVLLRHQLDVMTRSQTKPIKPNRAEKRTLAVLTKKLKQSTNRSACQLRGVIRILQPETVIRWHRELVQRKWSYQ